MLGDGEVNGVWIQLKDAMFDQLCGQRGHGPVSTPDVRLYPVYTSPTRL